MKLRKKFRGDYPYMNARTRARTSKLLDGSDYQKLVRMSLNEISKKLEEGQYKQEIDMLGSEYGGAELLEKALHRHAVNSLKAMAEMSPEEIESFIRTYTRRYDIQNIKEVTGTGDVDIDSIAVTGLELDREDLKELQGKTTEEIGEILEFGEPYDSMIEGCESISELDEALDRAHHRELEELCGKTGDEAILDLLKSEIEFNDIKTALRLKRYGAGREEVTERLMMEDTSETVESLAEAETEEEFLEILNGTEWSTEAETVTEAEHMMEVKRLERSLSGLREGYLGAAPVLGHIIAKMIEVENLETLVKAKKTGVMGQEEIMQSMVIAE